jgi:hypothetical protein
MGRIGGWAGSARRGSGLAGDRHSAHAERVKGALDGGLAVGSGAVRDSVVQDDAVSSAVTALSLRRSQHRS